MNVYPYGAKGYCPIAPEPVTAYVQYAPITPVCSGIVPPCSTPLPGISYEVPEGGIILRLSEDPVDDCLEGRLQYSRLFIYASSMDSVVGGHPISGLIGGDYVQEIQPTENQLVSACIPDNYILVGGYMPGSVITFNGPAYIIGSQFSSNSSPSGASLFVRYTLNGGDVTSDSVYFGYDEGSQVGIGSIDLAVAITDYIPIREGFTFSHWEIIFSHAFIGGSTLPAVGTEYTFGDEVTWSTSGATAAEGVVILQAQWNAA